MSDSWKNYVNHKSGGNRSNVGSVYGNRCIRLDDSRNHHATIDLLVYDPKESSSILQRYDASLGDSARNRFEVIIKNISEINLKFS